MLSRKIKILIKILREGKGMRGEGKGKRRGREREGRRKGKGDCVHRIRG